MKFFAKIMFLLSLVLLSTQTISAIAFNQVDIQDIYNTNDIGITVDVSGELGSVHINFSIFDESDTLILEGFRDIDDPKIFNNPIKEGKTLFPDTFIDRITPRRFCFEQNYSWVTSVTDEVSSLGIRSRYFSGVGWNFTGSYTEQVASLNCINILPLDINFSLLDGDYKIEVRAFDLISEDSTGNISFIVDTTEPNIIFKNNFTNGSEINEYEFILLDFFEVNKTNVNESTINYSYNGVQIPEIIITPFINRTIQGVDSYTGTSFPTPQDSSFRDLFFLDGLWYMLGRSNDEIFVYDENFTYTGTNFDISGETTLGGGLFHLNNLWYITDGAGDEVNVYDENFIYTGITHSLPGAATNDPSGIYHRESQNLWYIVATDNNDVGQYDENFTFIQAFSVNQDSEPYGLWFEPNLWYVVGSGDNEINVYDENFNFQSSFSVTAQDTNPRGVFIKDLFLYLNGQTTDTVYKYLTLFNDTIFRFPEAGNQTIHVFAQDLANNTLSQDVSIFVNPFQRFNFLDTLGQPITNYTFFNTFFEDEAVIKLFDIGLGNQTLTFEKLGFNTTDINLEFTNTSEYNLTIVLPIATIFVRIFDRETLDLLLDLTTVTLFETSGFIGTTLTGLLNITDQLLILGNYGLLAEHSGYASETIFFNFTNQEQISVDIFMLNESSPDFGSVIIKAQTAFEEIIQGAICKANEWNVNLSAYFPVSEGITNDQGTVILPIEIGTKIYEFSCSKDGVTVTNTRTIIQVDFTEVIVVLDTSVPDVTTDFEGITTNVTEILLTNITGNFSQVIYDFNNQAGDNVIACIKYFELMGKQRTLLNETCLEAPSGTILQVVDLNNTFDLFILATLEIQGKVYNIESFLHKNSRSIGEILKEIGLASFILIILIIISISVMIATKVDIIGEALAIICVWWATILIPTIWSPTLAAASTVILCLMAYWGYKAK